MNFPLRHIHNHHAYTLELEGGWNGGWGMTNIIICIVPLILFDTSRNLWMLMMMFDG